MERSAQISRKTKETDITVSFNIDGTGKADINTGIGFFDHMLDGFARHGLFDLEVKCAGDLNVDGHHTVEDVGIVLGKAIKAAAGDKTGIARYGSFTLPMDETLAMSAVDLSGRPYLVFDSEFSTEKCGDLDLQLVREFFYAVSYAAEMNIHVRVLYGNNDHHKCEAMFKAFAKALDRALIIDSRIEGVLSTKGSI